MLWLAFALLFVLWLLGYGFQVAGSMIHLLLAAALLLLVVNLVRQRRVEL
jgi:hypothetical protein